MMLWQGKSPTRYLGVERGSGHWHRAAPAGSDSEGLIVIPRNEAGSKIADGHRPRASLIIPTLCMVRAGTAHKQRAERTRLIRQAI